MHFVLHTNLIACRTQLETTLRRTCTHTMGGLAARCGGAIIWLIVWLTPLHCPAAGADMSTNGVIKIIA